MSVTLEVVALEGHQGRGIARHGELTVFIAGAVPGDRVLAALPPPGSKRWVNGTLLRIEKRSPHRVSPTCPFHPQFDDPDVVPVGCGGCPHMILRTSFASDAKKETAQRALKQNGITWELGAPIQAGPRERYRWRIRARFQGQKLGFNAFGSDTLFPISDCKVTIQGGLLKKLAPCLPRSAEGEVRITTTQRGTYSLHVVTSRPSPIPSELRALVRGRGDLVGVHWNGTLSGAPHINLGSDDSPFYIAHGGFAQAGPYANALIRSTLREMLQQIASPEPMLECYAGSGNLTQVATDFGEVTASESVASVREAFQKNLGPEHALIIAPTEKLRWSRPVRTLILDPPRSGITKKAMTRLVSFKAAHVILFACDPMAGARDLSRLLAAGYTLQFGQLLDTMPSTPHFEMAFLLSK